MDHLIGFVINHWALSLAFVVALALVIVEELRSRGKGGGMVSAEAAVQLINREDAAVLDLRAKTAFKSGHIVGAINLPKDQLLDQLSRIKSHQNEPIIVVCERGNDSTRAALTLRRQGFVRPLVLAGGIEAWKSAKYPLTKDSKEKKGG